MKAEIYFETLGAALESFVAQTQAKGGVFPEASQEDILQSIVARFYGGVSYGQTAQHSFELASFKGRTTKKCAQIALYRMESGRYELTCYVA